MKNIILTLLITVFTATAFADIIFIDLNNVPQEIAVARQGAKARGENLIVLPLDYAKYKDPVREKLNVELEKADIASNEACGGDQASSANCDAKSKFASGLHAKLESLPSPKYTPELIKKDLESVQGDITSIMISAHDGDASFKGEYGEIKAEEFIDMFKNYSGRDKIRSLYLLGCRSAQAETFAETWKVAFPKAGLIAGYENIGYLRDNPAGANFIKNILAAEQGITTAKDFSAAQVLFNRASVVDKRHGTAACVTLKNQDAAYLSSSKSPGVLKDILKCPEYDLKKITDYRDCAIKGGSTCPFNEASKVIPSQRCKFILEEQTNEATQLRDQIYFFSLMGHPGSNISAETLFGGLYPDIKQRLNLKMEDFATYPKIKTSLERIKNEFEKRMSYPLIKDYSAEAMAELARQKEFYDKAWLAISNLDVSKTYFKLSGTPGLGGVLRAQAFAKTKSSETMAGRISALTTQLNSEQSELGQKNLKAEIEALKSYQ